MSLMKDDTIFKVPVLQTFDESVWSIAQDGFNCFADFKVVRLGVFNALPYQEGFRSDRGTVGWVAQIEKNFELSRIWDSSEGGIPSLWSGCLNRASALLKVSGL